MYRILDNWFTGYFGAFIFLFRKRQDKQNPNEQTSIATILETQNENSRVQNDLIAQLKIFRNTSILKGQDDITLEGHLKKKLKRKIKIRV
jgi:hypothetical protein